MIDYDALKETSDGDRHDRLTSLLIGIIAVMAALLVVIQGSSSLAEACAGAQARRLASELTTRIIAGGNLANHQGVNSQRALLVSLEGNSRQLVALETGDEAERLVGEAQAAAGDRLFGIASAMGATPTEDSALDPYARDMLATTSEELLAVLAEQNRQADLADEASFQSTVSVLALSVLALAGVLVGLGAVVGGGRAGWALLAVAWVAGSGAGILLVIAAGLVPDGLLPVGPSAI